MLRFKRQIAFALLFAACLAPAFSQEEPSQNHLVPIVGTLCYVSSVFGTTALAAVNPVFGLEYERELADGFWLGAWCFAGPLFDFDYAVINYGFGLILDYYFTKDFSLQLNLGYPCGIGFTFCKTSAIRLYAFMGPMLIVGASYGFKIGF